MIQQCVSFTALQDKEKRMGRHKKNFSNAADVDNGVGITNPAPFDPGALTKEQQEAIVEEYLGVHPKYFLYKGLNIALNMGKFRFDGKHFNGWKPKSHKYNGFDG